MLFKFSNTFKNKIDFEMVEESILSGFENFKVCMLYDIEV